MCSKDRGTFHGQIMMHKQLMLQGQQCGQCQMSCQMLASCRETWALQTAAEWQPGATSTASDNHSQVHCNRLLMHERGSDNPHRVSPHTATAAFLHA